MEPPDLVANQFRYRKAVRCIAITDICIALFMLAFFGLRIFAGSPYVNNSQQEAHPLRTSQQSNNNATTYILSNSDPVPNIFILICLCIFSVYSIQLIMGQVLLSATYHNDKDIVLARCSRWYWTSQFLNVMQGMELFLLVFSTRGGTPAALGILVMKIIFRAIASHMVKVFMWDLRTPQQLSVFPLPILPMPSSNLMRATSRMRMPRQMGEGECPPRGEEERCRGVGGGGFGNLSAAIPMYEPPPSYAEAVREKNFPQDYNQVA